MSENPSPEPQKPAIEDFNEYQKAGYRHKIIYSHIIEPLVKRERIGPPPVSLLKIFRPWGKIIDLKLKHNHRLLVNGAELTETEFDDLLTPLLAIRMEKHGGNGPLLAQKRPRLPMSLVSNIRDFLQRFGKREVTD